MSSNQIIILAVILLYMGATVAISMIVTARQRKKKEALSNDDFLLAGKSLGPFVLAGSLFAANTGGASTLGIATNVARFGLSASWYVIAAGIGFVIVSFIAPYFRRSQASTVPEIINKRYGKPSHIVTAFTSITALFMATGAQIIATASIINVLTGFDFRTAAVITTVVTIIYTMTGGYKSVTAANVMHLLFITVGMGLAMVLMVNHKDVGGFSALFAKASAMTNAEGANLDLLSMTKIGIPTILGYIAMYSMTFPTGQEIVQTYCSARDGKAAKTGSVLAGLISASFALIPAMIGLVAVTCIPGLIDDPAKVKTALATATLTFSHPIVGGLVLSAIVAATMSSASGNMIGTATMFTRDLYTPYIKKGARDNKSEVLITQITMVVVGVVGLTIALTASNIISVMMGAFALRSAGPFAAFIFGLFSKNVTKRAGFISIISGTVVAAYWIYGLKSPWGLSAMVPGGLVAFIVIYAVTLIDKQLGKEPAPPIQLDNE